MILTAKENEMINENTHLTRDEMIDFIITVAADDYEAAECYMENVINFSGVDEDEDEDEDDGYPDVNDGWIDAYVLVVAEGLEKATDKEVAAEYEEALDTYERLKIDVAAYLNKMRA